ncbi:malto-oligosyltrehalose trehalohydrolase [Bdellovibrio sp. HCB185ZH]|uniref:malto-oligosyltrehalose trehalohydrolase n=1 Tax=Bdellovibrio sp. HCB185ZH TaxID=3394235 RepID=UPI0039A6545A
MKRTHIGAWQEGDYYSFRVWAPACKNVDVVLYSSQGKVLENFPMQREERGYFRWISPGKPSSDLYKFKLDGKVEIPDPASRYQPEGPHGPSQFLSSDFNWTDSQWRGLPLNQLVIYELHVGTFTPEGTFSGIKKHVDRLLGLGVNCIEIMPIAQFAGRRNWGYDGVGIFAAQNSYGSEDLSPLELKSLVNYCHERGMAVLLDVVYNHMGPEGNYLSMLGPYFHDKYKNPWGDALNFDGAGSDEVKNFFLSNAQQWMEEFHFDGLRLDAVHSIMDGSAKHFLEHLADLRIQLSQRLRRDIHLIAENDTNDPRLVLSQKNGGFGLSAHWADDFHHVVHTLLTHEISGYYSDFGVPEQITDVLERGVVFDGQYSQFHNLTRGRDYSGVDRSQLVYCIQNHDQIGNRKDGERLIQICGAQKSKLAAALLFLSGGLPLIFMGEEVGATVPFLYFVDHTDPKLLQAVREGRKKEFASFGWKEEPPDPGSEETFNTCRVCWEAAATSEEAQAFSRLYGRLIQLSKWIREQGFYNQQVTTQKIENEVFRIQAGQKESSIDLVISLKNSVVELDITPGQEILFDSSSSDFGKPLTDHRLRVAPFSVVLLKGV